MKILSEKIRDLIRTRWEKLVEWYNTPYNPYAEETDEEWEWRQW